MLPQTKIVVTPEKFDELFDEDANIAKFSSPAEEAAYEKRDSFLIHLIKKLVNDHFGLETEGALYILEDWWPNHTRYLDMVPGQCTLPFLQALHELLTEEFSDYRIQICVYANPMEGTTYIGSIALYARRLVIEAALHHHLRLDQSI
jgi:hypothetical protein